MKLVGRQNFRKLRDLRVVATALRFVYRGSAVACPCCESTFSKFRSFRGENRICWVCGSMERHRSLWLYLDAHSALEFDGMTVLHVAPERIFAKRFADIPRVRYLGGDLTAEFGPEKIDVTALTYDDSSVDAVVCNHVLEHVPDDTLAMREMRRVLKSGGWGVILVPDLEWNLDVPTDEDPSIADPRERERRFGQDDHVRRYGWDYVERLRDAGFSVEVVDPANEFGAEAVERMRLEKRGNVEPLFVVR